MLGKIKVYSKNSKEDVSALCWSKADSLTFNAELNPICHLQALLGAHYILHVFGIRVKLRLFCKSQNNIMKYK